jgi:hypothetical protein
MNLGPDGFKVDTNVLGINATYGLIQAQNIQCSALQGITVAPTANPLTTLASLSVQGNTVSSTTREFQVAFGLTNKTGKGLTGGKQDRVTLYLGHDMVAGCGDGWALNTVTTINVGANTSANAQGYELDFNNLLQHYGETLQGAGLAAPIAVGLSVTGASSKRSTSALLVAGPGTEIWNRGITFANASVKQATFQDLTNSATSIEILGTHTTGIDLSGASCTTSIKGFNFSVSGTGRTTVYQLNVSTPNVPANASAAGTKGDIAYDSAYIYTCVAANTWRRAATATW